MSKPTDYKRLWRKQEQKNIELTTKIEKLLAALDPGFEFLRKIITEEQYLELMKMLGIDVEFVKTQKKDAK